MLGTSLDAAVPSAKERLHKICAFHIMAETFSSLLHLLAGREQGQDGDQELPKRRLAGAVGLQWPGTSPAGAGSQAAATRSLAESGGGCNDSLQQLFPSERSERQLHGLRGKAGTEGEVLGS